MCGVTGRISFTGADVIPDILEDLIRLQNRGRDATGFVTGFTNKQVPYKPWKKLGSAGSLFGRESGSKAEELVEKYPGDIAVGHVRYTTAGERDNEATQPHGFKHGGESVIVASNGDIPFYDRIRRELEAQRGCRFASHCDAELIVNLVGLSIYNDRQDEIDAFVNVGSTLEASFSLVAITPSGKLLGMRDPWGVRPLFWALNEKGAMISSEPAIMDGFDDVREILPGSLTVISGDGQVRTIAFRTERPRFCLLEVYYFARPDSVFKGEMYDEIRYRLGYQTGLEWIGAGYPQPDLVVPVKYSGDPAAEGCAEALGVKLRSAVLKDRFGGRIFMFDQLSRAELLESNIKVVQSAVEGKRILMVDDSIIRADQSRVITKLLRQAGAREVYFISTAPPYRFPCFLGINTPETSKLVAKGRSVEEIRDVIGVDQLLFLSLEGTFEALGSEDFCTGCFVGKEGYPVPVPEDGKEV